MNHTYLDIIADHRDLYYVVVCSGADQIVMTPPLETLADAQWSIERIRSGCQLPIGRAA